MNDWTGHIICLFVGAIVGIVFVVAMSELDMIWGWTKFDDDEQDSPKEPTP